MHTREYVVCGTVKDAVYAIYFSSDERALHRAHYRYCPANTRLVQVIYSVFRSGLYEVDAEARHYLFIGGYNAFTRLECRHRVIICRLGSAEHFAYYTHRIIRQYGFKIVNRPVGIGRL